MTRPSSKAAALQVFVRPAPESGQALFFAPVAADEPARGQPWSLPTSMFSQDDLQRMWSARVAGREVHCTRCGKGRLGLEIDLVQYRWRCVCCSAASSWFVVKGGQVSLRILAPVRFVNPRAPEDSS